MGAAGGGISGQLSHFVSKRPIWLAKAADLVIARSPTTQRIAGSRHKALRAAFPGIDIEEMEKQFVAWNAEKGRHAGNEVDPERATAGAVS